MDLDLFDDVSGEFVLGRGRRSKRGATVARVVVGLLVVALAVAGAVHIGAMKAGTAFRSAGVCLFVAVGSFGLFNLVLLRSWRWPAWAVVWALAGLFVVRIAFGP